VRPNQSNPEGGLKLQDVPTDKLYGAATAFTNHGRAQTEQLFIYCTPGAYAMREGEIRDYVEPVETNLEEIETELNRRKQA
jgi:hypothetical protein